MFRELLICWGLELSDVLRWLSHTQSYLCTYVFVVSDYMRDCQLISKRDTTNQMLPSWLLEWDLNKMSQPQNRTSNWYQSLPLNLKYLTSCVLVYCLRGWSGNTTVPVWWANPKWLSERQSPVPYRKCRSPDTYTNWVKGVCINNLFWLTYYSNQK